MNRVNMDNLNSTIEKAKKNPDVLRKVNRIEGEWLLEGEGPQFRAVIKTEKGDYTLEADQPSFLGGKGTAPGPMIYCLYGVTSCFAATFASIAAEKDVELKKLKVIAESYVDLSRSMGLTDNPVVDQVVFKVQCETKDSADVDEIKRLAMERCPAVYCLTNPIQLQVKLIEE